jgi:hypothetical protein
MRGVMLHAPGDIRIEDRDDPTIIAPTDAIIRVSAACVSAWTCGLTAASSRSPVPLRWGMSMSASSRRSAARSRT